MTPQTADEWLADAEKSAPGVTQGLMALSADNPARHSVDADRQNTEEIHSDLLKFEQSRSSAAQPAQGLMLDPLDGLRVAALAQATGRTAAETLHDLLHPQLTFAERRLKKGNRHAA